MIRRQLPAYSPVSLRAIARASLTSLRSGGGSETELSGYLASELASERVLLTGTGTQALELAIRLAQDTVEPGRPVALPAYSCFDVVTAAVGVGSPVTFFDVDPLSLHPDLAGVEGALTQGAATVVVSNLFGFPVDWTELKAMCRAKNAVLVEDAAQGLGTTWAGMPGGAQGDLTVLSFARGKGWTGGGGGALLLRDLPGREEPALPRLASATPLGGPRSAAISTIQWAFGRPSLFRIPSSVPGLGLGETRYKEPEPPSAMGAFSAGLLVETRAAAESEIQIRRRNGERLRDHLEQAEVAGRVQLIQPVPGGDASYLRFPLLLRDETAALPETRVGKGLGIGRGYPMALPHLPQVQSLCKEKKGRFPGAEQLSVGLATLPTHSRLTDADFVETGRLFEMRSRRGS